jgi:hypothetical protein
VALGEGLWQAAFSVNILLSLADKLITAVIVLILARPIARALGLAIIERQRIERQRIERQRIGLIER